MNQSTVLIVAGIGIGAYLLTTKKASAATQPQQKKVNAGTVKTSQGGALLLGALDRVLGAAWNVKPNTVQTVDWSSGAIGDYTGMTQDQANAQAVQDYNNQFISPFGLSPFQF
jgi:hypothetical protein